MTAMLAGRPCELSLRGGDARRGKLKKLYDGVRPQHNYYAPMRLQVAVGEGGGKACGCVNVRG